MVDVPNPVDQNDLAAVEERFRTYVETVQSNVKELVEIQTNALESLEKQLAQMSVGYLEQAVMIEALIEVMPPDSREEFKEYVKTRRKTMLEVLQGVNDNVLSGDGV